MFSPADYYYHSHVSVTDGSTAMVRAHNSTTIWLQNENGDVWSDPIDQWERIENPVYPAEWDDEEEDYDEDYFADMSYHYPEYDAQTAFYEQTGRMQFPNEY